VQLGYALSSEEHPPYDLVRYAQRAEEVGFSLPCSRTTPTQGLIARGTVPLSGVCWVALPRSQSSSPWERE
jgi:hypothetical protein